jgi:hypothetical protein
MICSYTIELCHCKFATDCTVKSPSWKVCLPVTNAYSGVNVVIILRTCICYS